MNDQTSNYETMSPAKIYSEAAGFGFIEIQGDDYFLQTRESLLREFDEEVEENGEENGFGDVTREDIEASPFWLLNGSDILAGIDGVEDPFDYLGGRAA